jgi:hypothetical protein
VELHVFDSDLKDRLFPLTELPNHLPRRNGKKVHYSTCFRWAKKGCRGRRLRTYPVGNILYTDFESVKAFLNPPTTSERDSSGADHLSAQRERQIAAAEAELDAAGI